MVTTGDIWQGDTLDRQKDGDTVYRFVMAEIKARRRRGLTASYVLNIDAEWGHGKSFFLNRLSTQLALDGHAVATVNAWENDLTNEPMVAVMSAIEDALKPHLSKGEAVKKHWNKFVRASGPLAVALGKGLATSLVKKHADGFLDAIEEHLGSGSSQSPSRTEEDSSVIGDGVAQVIEKISDDLTAGLIEAHRQHLSSIKQFRSNLAAIAASIRTNEHPDALIFILVDELDRCRPNHAIQLLESIKHLFNTDGIVFLIATNTNELAASVKAVYGNDFNSKRYLLRFFDRTFRFREVEMKTFISNLFDVYGIDPKEFGSPQLETIHCTASYFAAFAMSLRDMEQCFEIFATVHALWEHPVPLQLPLLWPLIYTNHAGQLDAFDTLRGINRHISVLDLFDSNVTVHKRTQRDFTSGIVHHIDATVSDLTEAYLNGYSTPLHELTVNSGSSIARRIANEYFTAEFGQLYGNRYSLNEPPFSVINTYADHVKLALQFKSSNNDAAGEDK
ncbi:KAP family P-loop NTPase fold protein [Sphingopyxis sp. A083]|uniref:KAP family P-loop NTPase fold protein n=1 Tax=Sphingopyxis sp. A083 TaxID=1759083 RepID=UPI00073676AC|nr:P-loop NTPase fold protein [Sphingopyxis sp. A083]KTE76959.1 hypothetical protein ATE59_08665 [Sphingopyxis sp. A083]